jgi:hypothetical protein
MNEREKLVYSALRECHFVDCDLAVLGNVYDVFEIHKQLDDTHKMPPYQITQILQSLKKSGFVILLEGDEGGRDCWALSFSEPDEPEIV